MIHFYNIGNGDQQRTPIELDSFYPLVVQQFDWKKTIIFHGKSSRGRLPAINNDHDWGMVSPTVRTMILVCETGAIYVYMYSYI